ncbi:MULTISPECIES: formate/nitrite transporter family protein [Burkholderia]|uniref:formate/nitrite transporter family protein n=1 Tax=Burkholderia TaxID=32008 RepID=UPI0009E9A234|nr:MULTISPECIES: formate/nitrite transporter family protein [Burkholderia]
MKPVTEISAGAADPATGTEKRTAEVPLFNALTPPAIARAAEDLGVKKAHYDIATLFVLAILGGAFISFGGFFAIVAMSGANGYMSFGITRLVGGVVFSLGLVLIMCGGAQLFTGDCLMVMAWASKRLRFREMIRVWVTVWVGNGIGAVATAVLLFLGGTYKIGHGAFGASALALASAKANDVPMEAFFLAILCNVMVCLAVWLSLAARSLTDKMLAIALPVAMFVAAGFEHCIADMFFVPFGLMIVKWAPQSFWLDLGHGTVAAAPPIPLEHFLGNLALITAGNWIGGALLVGAVYWFVFCRKRGH